MNEQELQYYQINKMFQRNTVRILEQDSYNLFIQDTISQVYVLWSKDLELSKSWLIKHEKEHYQFMMFYDEKIRNFANERYHIGEGIICYQAIYEGKTLSLPQSNLIIKTATIDDLEMIYKYYQNISKEEMAFVIEKGHLYLGYEDDQLAGFIGEHLEGSMGMLHIFEEYRNKGYGYLLEAYMINKTIQEGFIPYCHVVIDNTASLALQRKLGMSITKEKIYWLF